MQGLKNMHWRRVFKQNTGIFFSVYDNSQLQSGTGIAENDTINKRKDLMNTGRWTGMRI